MVVNYGFKVRDSSAGEIRGIVSDIFVSDINFMGLSVSQPVDPVFYTFVFDGFGEFTACHRMFLFGWMVLDVSEFVGFVAEFVLFHSELFQLEAPPASGEQGWFLH